MTLKTPEDYIASLNDGRVTYWDGEKIDDITRHPRFRVPIAIAARDYDHSDPRRKEVMTYADETGSRSHRVFQIPRSEDDLNKRIQMMHEMSIVGGVTGVFMALMSVKDAVAEANPKYAENIERMYRYVRDNDLRAAEVITDPKG
ncbi:MAG: 4-hydroxyphenylacetate 3-hydroxylase, partial [Alphaproteobacteria bacterium]|nr:4-hydroxyphenylacetate 3-hydroxylase [Alphaproteobacteria bacterium]